MNSWGCDLILGGHGGATFDHSQQRFIHACESWTDEHLAFSSSPLNALPVDTEASSLSRNAPIPLDTDLAGKRKASRLLKAINEQIGYYQSKYPSDYVPDDLLRECLQFEHENHHDSRSRHNVLHAYEDSHDTMVVVHPSGPTGSSLNFTPVYCIDCDEVPNMLITDWQHRVARKLATAVQKIQADRVDRLLAVSTVSTVNVFDKHGISSTHKFTIDEPVNDICISHHGWRLMAGGGDGGVYLWDIEGELADSNRLIAKWTAGQTRMQNVRHVDILAEYTYVAAGRNRLMLLDQRSRQKAADLVVDIGGDSLGFTSGNSLNHLLFISGPERLAAIDLRNAGKPIMQWRSAEFFGGALQQLQCTQMPSSRGDLLTGVVHEKEELLAVPILRQPSLNTITSLTPNMLCTLNYNRLYARLASPFPIMGHCIVSSPSHADQLFGFHMVSDGRIAYQQHSFSNHYTGYPQENESDLRFPHTGTARKRTKKYLLKDTINHTRLFEAATNALQPKYEAVLGSEERAVLQEWMVDMRSGEYLPQLFIKALQEVNEYSPAADGLSGISRAAQLLNKEWT